MNITCIQLILELKISFYNNSKNYDLNLYPLDSYTFFFVM
jgi:hypothetical protein